MMNIDEKIEIAMAYKDTLAQQIKSIEARHQELTVLYIREEGKLAALMEIQACKKEDEEAQ
jgi:hypothetical protein